MTVNEALARAAGQEMRRPAPEGGDRRPAKRRKKGEEPVETDLDLGDLQRFDYGVEEALRSGFVGLLASCKYNREKSATRELISVIQLYLTPSAGCGAEFTPVEKASEAGTSADKVEAEAARGAEGQKEKEMSGLLFSNVKLACRGMVLLKVEWKDSPEMRPGVAAAVSALIQDVTSWKRKKLEHCQRVWPVQTTCLLEETAISAACRQLVRQSISLFRLKAEINATAADQPPSTPQPTAGNGVGKSCGSEAEPGEKEGKGEEAGPQEAEGNGDKASNSSQGGKFGEPRGETASVSEPSPHEGRSEGAEEAGSSAAAGSGKGSAAKVEGQEKGREGKGLAVRYAGSYKRRVESTGPAAGQDVEGKQQLLSREAVFKAVAVAVEAELAGDISVQVSLKNPQVVVTLETVPFGKHSFCCLCCLDTSVVEIKTNLGIKSVGAGGNKG